MFELVLGTGLGKRTFWNEDQSSVGLDRLDQLFDELSSLTWFRRAETTKALIVP